MKTRRSSTTTGSNINNAVAPHLDQAVDGVSQWTARTTTMKRVAGRVPNVIGFYRTDPDQINESEIGATNRLRPSRRTAGNNTFHSAERGSKSCMQGIVPCVPRTELADLQP
jgi:hypothetical protein